MRSVTLDELRYACRGVWHDWIVVNKSPWPVEDWWPQFSEEWGGAQVLPRYHDGFFAQFWRAGDTYCFYDRKDALLGRFRLDAVGPYCLAGNGSNVFDSDTFSLTRSAAHESVPLVPCSFRVQLSPSHF